MGVDRVVIAEDQPCFKMDANPTRDPTIAGSNTQIVNTASQISKDLHNLEKVPPIHSIMKKSAVTKPSKSVKVDVGAAPTRTSQRQIKRPKMDDELIDFESSSRGSTSKKPKIVSSTSTIAPKSLPSVSK